MIHKSKYEDMDANDPFFHRLFTNNNLNKFIVGFICGMIFTIVILSNFGII